MTQRIGIGLAGFGTVGAGVYKNLLRNAALLEQRIGFQFEVRKIAVRDLKKARDVQAPAEIFTASPDDLLADPSIDVVVELMGGIDIPLAFVKKAIAAGKIVITGNKALLAEHGPARGCPLPAARVRRAPLPQGARLRRHGLLLLDDADGEGFAARGERGWRAR